MFKGIRYKEGFNPLRIRLITMFLAFIPALIAVATAFAVFNYALEIFPRTTMLPLEYQAGQDVKTINWDFLGSITSLATLALIMGGVVFASIDYVQNAVQRKREESQSSFGMYKEMYERLMNENSLAARRWVIINLPTLEEMNDDQQAWLARIKAQINHIPDGAAGGRAPGKEHIKRILNDFDFIGFVNKNYWQMESELVEWMSSPVAKVWERIKPYVEEEAKLRNEPDYYEYACRFGDYCVTWRKENRPRSIKVPDAT